MDTDNSVHPTGNGLTNIRSEDEFVRDIHAAHQQSVQGFIACGKLLIEAKAELEEQSFEQMIKDKLPFKARTAQRLMEIARDQRFLPPDTLCRLPSHWGTLYALTRLDDDEFGEKLDDGTIHPSMTRGAAKSKYDERDPDTVKSFLSWAAAGTRKIEAISDPTDYQRIPRNVVDAIATIFQWADTNKHARKKAGD
jgi:hypothetical protein